MIASRITSATGIAARNSLSGCGRFGKYVLDQNHHMPYASGGALNRCAFSESLVSGSFKTGDERIGSLVGQESDNHHENGPHSSGGVNDMADAIQLLPILPIAPSASPQLQ